MTKKNVREMLSNCALLCAAATNPDFLENNAEAVADAQDSLFELLSEWRDDYWPAVEEVLRRRSRTEAGEEDDDV